MAPMVDLSHEAYRDLVRSFGGCDLFYSEMLNSRILPSEKPGESLYLKWHDTKELILQILGNDPDLMKNAAEKLLNVNPWGIDINMGCWLKKITVHGWGLALMKDINLAQKVVESVRGAIKVPLSVKIRIGYSLDKSYLLDFVSMLEGSGVDFIVLHGRTALDGLNRPARWEYIAFVKEHLKIPVIGNGDIKSARDALSLLQQTSCDGVMVGRQALRQPWIFRDIKAALNEEPLQDPPDLKEVMITLTYLLEKYFSPIIAVKRFKVAFPWLAENLVFGHYLVKEIGRLHSMDDIRLKIEKTFADGIT
jgi:tRNA-dihydrouridine synthase B